MTVTSLDEADEALAVGADMLCAQGVEAGAHRGTFSADQPDQRLPLSDLIAALRGHTHAPIIATGGIARPEDLQAVVAAGADAAQLGTAFLRSDESGASDLHKNALVDPAYPETTLTRAFTGRFARGLVNRFIREHPTAPAAYPEIHHATRPLRSAALANGDADSLHLWAGTGHRHARTGTAASIANWLTGSL